jgi:hypothetical protein
VSSVRGLPTNVRLAVGGALCLLPLGLVWSASSGFVSFGYVIYGDCAYSVDEVCTPDTYVPGAYLPGSHVVGAQATARVFLVLAALVLGFAASRIRTPATKRLVRVATGAIGAALALAVAERAVSAVVCLVFALGLVAPLVWPNPMNSRKSGVFVPGPASR